MGMQREDGFRIENSKIQKNKRIQNMVGRKGRGGREVLEENTKNLKEKK